MDVELPKQQEDCTEILTKVQMITLWRGELHKNLSGALWNYNDCEYKCSLGEWHPTEALLRDIAKTINRSGHNDLKDNDLANLLVYDVTKFCKENNTKNQYHSVD